MDQRDRRAGEAVVRALRARATPSGARGSGAPLMADPLPAGRRRNPTDAETCSRRGKLRFDLRVGRVAR